MHTNHWRNPLWRHLTCFACSTLHSVETLATVCTACAMPLRVDFDFASPPERPAGSAGSQRSMWRHRGVLPVAAGHEVSLGEGATPLLPVAPSLWVKDEACNPTGSFKARGMSAAVSAARALGVAALRAPSAGNAAGALAAYGAAAGIPVVVAMPDDTPRLCVEECRHYGAEVVLVPGTISDAAKWLRQHGPQDAFDVSTLREPHRIEGKKTMGFELWEDFGGELPDVVVYPTGGGTGLIAMWKAWQELRQLGWIGSERPAPRMVSVQAAGCAPIVTAFHAGASATQPAERPITRAWGLRVPAPLGGFLCLRAIRETGGTAVAVAEAAIADAAKHLARRSGVDVCPEGGAAWAATQELLDSGWIQRGERVVVFNTGTGLKYRD